MSRSTEGQKDNISKELLQELAQRYSEKGFEGIIEGAERSLQEWENVPLNIAVTGSSGCGKSTFINAIRGLTADDEGAAEDGVTETTQKPTRYLHPDNRSLALWDLPGVGSTKFPKQTYVQQVEFGNFDFFLILTCGRFTENDLWLAKQVQSLHKRFYFIRTKVDLDVSNNMKAHPKTHSRSAVLDQIRRDIVKQLQDNGFEAEKMFLINSFETTTLDFGSLSASLIKDSPEFKKEALVLSLSSLSEDVIREKAKVLRKRIYRAAIISAVAAAAPIPGVGTLVDIKIMQKEAIFYRKQLRLDDRSIHANAAALNTTRDELTRTLSLKIGTINFTASGLLAFFGSLELSNSTEEILSITIPAIGSLLAAGLSFGTQVICLEYLLKSLVEDAVKINKKLASAFVNKYCN